MGKVPCLSEQLLKLLNCEAGLPNQAPENSRPKLLMQRYGQNDWVAWLGQSYVAASLTIPAPTRSHKSLDCSFSRTNREFCHRAATSISVTSILVGNPWAWRVSRLRVIASWMLVRASARVFPWETQPGKEGHSTTK